MSMVKPIALTKNAFDATNNEVFSYTSTGGNQIVKNKITIRRNSDNSIVYTNTVETFAFNQTVPSGTLTNGQYYNYFFNTYDINNNESPNSNIVPFYCFTQPTLIFTNVSNNTTIESSNFLFIVQYNQSQGELLDNLKFILYDINGNILSESETLYSTETPPFQMSYLFEGMDNNTSYQIQVTGSTVNGTQIQSSRITFEVRFENPAVYTKIDLENKCDEGYVQFRSNLVFIDAISNPDPPIYIGNESVDLGKIGHWVEWLQGYEIPSNFILELWMVPSLLGEFCKLWNNSDLNKYIKLNIKRDIFEGETKFKDCFEVYALGGNGYVRTYSNKVDLLNNLSEIVVWVKKINNTWELILDVQERTENVLNWNQTSNAVFNKITNLYWKQTGIYTRYSPNSDGSNMTIEEQENSQYIGIGHMPEEIYENANIYTGTKDFSGSWVNLSSWSTANSYQGFSVRQKSSQWEGIYENVDSLENETYTFSALVRTTADTSIAFSAVTGGEAGSNGLASFDIISYPVNPDVGVWTRVYGVFRTTSSGIIRPSFEIYSTTGSMEICALKLEKGITQNATWTPAISDWLNDSSNYNWTLITTGGLLNQDYETEDIILQAEPEHIGNVDDIFPITNLKISNGIFDNINVTRDTSKAFSILMPVWNYNTILDCDFDNSINGGNTNILLSQLEGLKIKRREKGSFNWITLKDIVVNSVADLSVVYQDSYVPSFHTFQWALVPILNGAIEAEYIINEIKASFNGIFISNKSRIFKLYNSVGYGGTTRVKNTGIIQTIGSKYPTFINNSVVDYEQGEITATLYGYEFEDTRIINPVSVVQQTNDLLSFLNDGTAKIITDWNSNIKLVRINPSPTVSYNQSYGNRITTITFQWTEQGVYDNQEDLYYNELLDVLG